MVYHRWQARFNSAKRRGDQDGAVAEQLRLLHRARHIVSRYGHIRKRDAGEQGLEFYNERNPEDYIQIPWDEIDRVAASVMFGGKKIARFAIFVHGSESGFSFSTRDNKATLRAMREHVPEEKLLRSLSFFDVIKRGVLSLFRKNR